MIKNEKRNKFNQKVSRFPTDARSVDTSKESLAVLSRAVAKAARRFCTCTALAVEFYRHREDIEKRGYKNVLTSNQIFSKSFQNVFTAEGLQTSRFSNLLCCGFDKHDLTVVPSCYGCIKNVFVIFAIIVPVVYEWLLHPASSANATCKTTPFHTNKVLAASPDVIQTSSKCLDMSRTFALTWLDSPESRVRLSSLLCREMTSAPNPATNRER